jgi:hypothetical protein
MKLGFDPRTIFVLCLIDVNRPFRTDGGDRSKGVSRATDVACRPQAHVDPQTC